jgi:hypothetical protein
MQNQNHMDGEKNEKSNDQVTQQLSSSGIVTSKQEISTANIKDYELNNSSERKQSVISKGNDIISYSRSSATAQSEAITRNRASRLKGSQKKQYLNANSDSEHENETTSSNDVMHKFYTTRLKHSLIVSFLFLIPIQNFFLCFISQLSEQVIQFFNRIKI